MTRSRVTSNNRFFGKFFNRIPLDSPTVIRSKTRNNWYITKPCFSLQNRKAGRNIFLFVPTQGYTVGYLDRRWASKQSYCVGPLDVATLLGPYINAGFVDRAFGPFGPFDTTNLLGPWLGLSFGSLYTSILLVPEILLVITSVCWRLAGEGQIILPAKLWMWYHIQQTYSTRPNFPWPIPVVARSKACVCTRSFAGILGLGPTGGMTSVASVVCFQAEVSATSRSLVQRSPTECVCVYP